MIKQAVEFIGFTLGLLVMVWGVVIGIYFSVHLIDPPYTLFGLLSGMTALMTSSMAGIGLGLLLCNGVRSAVSKRG